MPSDPPWRGDLWPGGRRMGSGGRLLLEDSKSTSLIGYHLPFPYPHLCNWRIDQLALLHIVSSTLSSLRRLKCSMEAAIPDIYVPANYFKGGKPENLTHFLHLASTSNDAES